MKTRTFLQSIKTTLHTYTYIHSYTQLKLFSHIYTHKATLHLKHHHVPQRNRLPSTYAFSRRRQTKEPPFEEHAKWTSSSWVSELKYHECRRIYAHDAPPPSLTYLLMKAWKKTGVGATPTPHWEKHVCLTTASISSWVALVKAG